MPDGPALLAVRFSSLGDVILTTPLFRAVRLSYPEARITVVTKAQYAPILERSPHVTDVEVLGPGESVRELARRLRRVRWDHLLDLHGSLRSLALRALLPGRWGTYSKRRVTRFLLVRWGINRFGRHRAAAERYFDAAATLGIRPDGAPPEVIPLADDEEHAQAILGQAHDFVALAPGARHQTKRWPAEYWRTLSAALATSGQATVGVGTQEERLLMGDAPIIDAFGADLGTTAAIIRRARVTVANDSGLMHLATAVGTPVVALFGPTVEAFGFFPYRSPGVILERPLSCRPCSSYGGMHCPLGHHRCMIDIPPQEVAAAVAAA